MSTISTQLWTDILSYLRQFHADLVQPGFSRLTPTSLEHGVLTINAPDSALLTYLRTRCAAAFAEAAQAVLQYLVSVQFVQRTDAPRDASPAASPRLAEPPRLNSNYTFELFVTGPENRMAQAACRAAAESPGKAYNPLFVHGDSGLGKTHLLQAICHEILAANARAQVAYLTCEEFVNAYIESLSHGNVFDFRHRYRDADVLVVDDVQFLTERERSQDEFFHTFNTLYQSQRQIVLSADCAPAEINGLAERLVSRFQWGLVARIDPLCIETRIAILRSKARIRGLEIPDDALDYIGTVVRGNVRELEGALAHVKAHSDALCCPITLATSRQALGGSPLTDLPRQIDMQQILNAVTERFNVKLSELRGPRRHRSIVLARQTCMYLARQMTPHSLEEIGAFFGNRDHSTVLHAQKTISQRCELDEQLRRTVSELEQQLRGRYVPAVS